MCAAGGVLNNVDGSSALDEVATVYLSLNTSVSTIQRLIDAKSSVLSSAGISALTFTAPPCASAPGGQCSPGEARSALLTLIARCLAPRAR